MSKRDDIIDDDGNVILPPPADSDVANLIYLLEYGRKRGFMLGPAITVGATTVMVRDLRQMAQQRRDSSQGQAAMDPDMELLLGGGGNKSDE